MESDLSNGECLACGGCSVGFDGDGHRRKMLLVSIHFCFNGARVRAKGRIAHSYLYTEDNITLHRVKAWETGVGRVWVLAGIA